MIKNFYCVAFVLLFISTQALSQKKPAKKEEAKSVASASNVPDTLDYEHFYLMYVDNSRAERGDELTGAAKDMIEHVADSVSKANDVRFFIYASNGIDPVICDDSKRVSKLVGSIMDGANTTYPDDKSIDKEQLRTAIYKVPFRITKDMRFDYFVTEYFAKSLLKEDGNLLITSFVNELCFMLAGDSVSVTINFYYTNKTDEAKKEQLRQLLSFNSTSKNIHFNIIPFN